MKLLCCEPCPWHGFADVEWDIALDRYNALRRELDKGTVYFSELVEVEHDPACCRCKINAKLIRSVDK